MADSPFRMATTLVSRWWRVSVVDRYRLWSVRVDGVEVTQSIQFYHAADHLTDSNDRSPDNSVQLVANKAAWVRVYVRSGLVSSVAGVTGTLRVEHRRLGFVFDPPETFNPQPPGNVTTQDLDYATERGDVANTLNFIIPAESFFGTMRLIVRLTDSSGSEYDTETLTISAALVQTLRVRAILVSYDGPSTSVAPGSDEPDNIHLAAPTLADVQATAATALRVMPVEAEGNFAQVGSVLNWTTPLDDPRTSPGSCSPNWGLLLDEFTNRRTNDGNRTDVVYYGLLPAGMPLEVPGCGRSGLGSAMVGNERTFLHEIGHGYGFQHTPCGNTGSADPNYPTYEPYPSASIGEYGLDISNGNVFSPQDARDYMSYCNPRWMSLYQHSRLIGHARLDPRWIVEYPWWLDYEIFELELIPKPDPPPYQVWSKIDMRVNPIISITGFVRSPREVEVTTVARVMAAGMPPGVRTPLKAHLLNAQGKTVAEGAIFRLDTQGGCGCEDGHGDPAAPPYAFQAFLSDTEPGAELRIMDGEEKIWSRRAPERRPLVASFDAVVTKDDQLELRWEAESSAEKLDVWAQWSDDQGKSWHGLTTGLAGPNATLGLSGLPEGEILVRVLVHDGFFTAMSESVRVKVPMQAPEVAILHPRDGQTLYASRTLHLWAAATNSAGKTLPPESNRWLLDDREVGSGNEAWLQTPPEGEHKATFIVPWQKGEIVRSVRFKTIRGEKNQPQSSSHYPEPKKHSLT